LRPPSSTLFPYTTLFRSRSGYPKSEFYEISFKDLPLYSYDYDADYPEVATKFKKAITNADGILFVTPEYNRSIPGALKNAIDWADRKSTRLNSSHVKISY